MNNNKILIKVAFSVYVILALLYNYAEATIHTLHDNKIKIVMPNYNIVKVSDTYADRQALVTKVTFALNDKCITHKQPYKGVSVSLAKGSMQEGANVQVGPPSIATLNVKAGRHQSFHPANCFSDWINKIQFRSASGVLPGKLNFAVKGTLTYTYTTYHLGVPCKNDPHSVCYGPTPGTDRTLTIENLVFGQDKNSWWLASPNCQGNYNTKASHDKSVLNCKTKTGKKVCLSLGKDSILIKDGQC